MHNELLANAEVDQAPNLAAVTAAKNKAKSSNTAMGNLKHALAEKDNTKRSVNYTDADQPKQQANVPQLHKQKQLLMQMAVTN